MPKKSVMPELVIDPEFESCIPPLTKEEFDQLEENILEMHRVVDPIIVWDKNIIVDGHNRYRIAKKHPGIYFQTDFLNVDTREEVIDWICKNQLGRRNLTSEQKKNLIGKQYESEKQTRGGDRRSEEVRSIGQNDHLKSERSTRARIAKENNVSESYVKRAYEYAKGLDILDSYVTGVQKRILNGELKIPEKDIRRLATIPNEARGAEALALISLGDGESKRANNKKENSLQSNQSESESIDHDEAVEEHHDKIISEMKDDLDMFMKSWSGSIKKLHHDHSDVEDLTIRSLFLTGLEFIRGIMKEWNNVQ